MASLLLFTALLLGGSFTATTASQTTWAAVTFTYHGEKTPDLLYSTSVDTLTAVGAHQLVSAGSAIRARYVSGNGSSITPAFPINGLSAYAIDNSQLFMLSTDDEFIAASAQAFLQGLYPPVGSNGQGSEILGNGSLEQYPLGGYQYANIGTTSTLDYNYIWIAGNTGCTSYEIEEALYLSSLEYENINLSSSEFYTAIQSSVFTSLDSNIVNYANAYVLYEYALYESIHNGSIQNTITDSDLDTLSYYASTQQFALNSGNSSEINTIAGATLAAKVLEMFGHNIASTGVSDKLSLLFGSFEPFLAFFSLSGLSTAYQFNTQFTNLPLHGSVMTFELFSNTPTSSTSNASTPFPDISDLYVRFLFRNGTDDSEPIQSYPLFGRGNSEADMSYSDFVQGMSDFALTDAATWCNSCGSINIFCEAIASDTTDPSDSSSHSKHKIKPWVAGVIGATVTLTVCVLAGTAFAVLGGARIGIRSRKTSLGGFKGAKKMQSDADLTVVGAAGKGKGGSEIRHERVGSWELGSADKKEEARMDRVVSGADYGRQSEDGIGNANPFGDGVKALDQV